MVWKLQRFRTLNPNQRSFFCLYFFTSEIFFTTFDILLSKQIKEVNN